MSRQENRDRLARNEASFRSINETLNDGLKDAQLAEGELAGFACECGDADCAALVHVELPKYEEVRAHSARFLVVPGHEVQGVEDVVEQGERYAVVQKHEDVRAILEQADPRR